MSRYSPASAADSLALTRIGENHPRCRNLSEEGPDKILLTEPLTARAVFPTSISWKPGLAVNVNFGIGREIARSEPASIHEDAVFPRPW